MQGPQIWIRTKMSRIHTTAFKELTSVLLCNCFSLGIDDPITKTAAGSERVYYQQLAKEMFLILDQPIQVMEGRKVVMQFCSFC